MRAAFSRVRAVAGAELIERGRRGLLFAWAGLTLLLAFGLVAGNVTVTSGSSAVGGAKAVLTSGFALAQLVATTSIIVHAFFAAFVAGMPALRDRELRTHDLLFSTQLSPREWIAGKHAAALATTFGILLFELVLIAIAAHVLPLAPIEVRGPFTLRAYAIAFFGFGVPSLVFVTGLALAVAVATAKRAPVAILPLALLLLLGFGVWSLPTTLARPLAAALGLLDPSGFSWLRFEWLAEDRGVAFYNQTQVPLSAAFVATRAAFVAVGLVLPVAVAKRVHAHATDKGRPKATLQDRSSARPSATPATPLRAAAPSVSSVVLAELRMTRSHAGLWLVVPLTLLVSVQDALALRGAFDTDLSPTPGALTVKSFGMLSTLVVALTMFVVTESFAREHASRVFALVTTTRVTSRALVIGKVLAALAFGAAVFALGGAVLLVIVAVANPASLSAWPLLLIFGALGLPTVFFAASFFACAFTLVCSRYATYAIGLGALVASGFAFVRGHFSWWSNWPLWKTLTWSDMSVLELDRRMLIANRLTVIAFGVALLSAAVLRYARREPDGDDERATPSDERRRARWRLALLATPAVVLFAALVFWTETSRDGALAKKSAKDYWRANVRTFADAPAPRLTRVALRVWLDPRERIADVEGVYELVNETDKPLRAVPLTLGTHMRAPRFTVDGVPVSPEARAGLYLVAPEAPLLTGRRVTVGFSYHADFGGGLVGSRTQEFLVPSGGTLTSFDATFVPAVGFVEGLGVDDDNRAEPRVYDDDFHLGVNPGLHGAGSFAYRLEVTVPSEYRVSSVGVLARDDVHDGKRTMSWEADAPIRFFNVVVGRGWQEARRGDVAVHHFPAHDAQVPEMLDALARARARYSEWFYPYPWKELRINEFPGLVHYAQGHPTNINFSESIGFLSARGENLPFAITAHEVGHQWWGTLVNPARGPGASVMTEGLSHMSALLLLEDVKGPAARRAFALSMENHYAKERSVDGERPLVRVSADADRRGDRVLVYDRAGWAFWMLARHLGMDRLSSGLHAFVDRYRDNPDHPALEDLFATLREAAASPARFDGIVTTWFRTSATPRFRVADVRAADRHVTFRLYNDGSGTIDVPVAIVGRDQRRLVTATVSPEAPAEIVTDLPFDPTEIVVDPDVEVLQLGRAGARARL